MKIEIRKRTGEVKSRNNEELLGVYQLVLDLQPSKEILITDVSVNEYKRLYNFIRHSSRRDGTWQDIGMSYKAGTVIIRKQESKPKLLKSKQA